MSDNAIAILDDILKDKRSEIAPELSEDDFFELFAAEQILKDAELSYEEIESGIVDGEHDGGIDAFYTFVDGDLIDEEISIPTNKKSPEINVIIVQAKSKNGFSEATLNSLIATTKNILDLNNNLDDLSQYNGELKARADIFRKCYRRLATKFPSLSITYIYAAKRASEVIHPNLEIKAKELTDQARNLYDEAEVKVNLWGAKGLLSLARSGPTQTFELKFDKSLNGENGYIALVRLSDFFVFLCGGGETVRSDLFEANVRDYQGSTEVNEEIAKTLRGDTADDFWWFNNGVTVLASHATSAGSILTIRNPQIVNGLQTSSQIASFFEETKQEDDRTVMVKVVASEDEEIRDRIIKATNNQNPVPQCFIEGY